jgi:hypothetical protein
MTADWELVVGSTLLLVIVLATVAAVVTGAVVFL